LVSLAASSTQAQLTAAAADAAAPVLFFDGECGFCDRAIRFAMAHDVRRRLYASPLQGVTASRVLPPFANALAGVDSVVLYRPATPTQDASVQVHSDAALSVLRMLGGGWSLLGYFGLLVPRWIRDVAYKAFAKRRFRLFGRVQACELWPEAWRARMLP
jgi:predicted DCC family thiol-disulfide oxidoreductase YuxK